MRSGPASERSGIGDSSPATMAAPGRMDQARPLLLPPGVGQRRHRPPRDRADDGARETGENDARELRERVVEGDRRRPRGEDGPEEPALDREYAERVGSLD